MMQQSIENQKKNALSQERMDRATDHLINPKEFQMMDQLERMRNKVSREKKKTDDLQNRVIAVKKKQADNKLRKLKVEQASIEEEPFYERLRRADKEYQDKKR